MIPITVEERFELLALVFRLAGKNKDYNRRRTRYQRLLSRRFRRHKTHPAVAMAGGFTQEGGQAFFYAMHLAKAGEGFRLLPIPAHHEARIESIMPGQTWLWNRSAAAEFLPLLNDFYHDTNFGAFFRAQTAYYEKAAGRFARRYLRRMDPEWFRRYLDPAQLRCVLLPSLPYLNLSMTVDGVVYAGVCEGYTQGGGVIVHEFCHHFANPIAEQWYARDPAFRALCDEPITPKTQADQYTPGLGMAFEYLTRAFTVLYDVQHGGDLRALLRKEVKRGFPHIKTVYEMIPQKGPS